MLADNASYLSYHRERTALHDIRMPTADAMMTSMRTTIRIDDEVYRRVKRIAAQSDRTFGQVIEDAVQVAFRPSSREVPIAELPVYGGSGLMPGVDLTSNRSVAEAMDEGVPADALR